MSVPVLDLKLDLHLGNLPLEGAKSAQALASCWRKSSAGSTAASPERRDRRAAQDARTVTADAPSSPT